MTAVTAVTTVRTLALTLGDIVTRQGQARVGLPQATLYCVGS